MVVDREILRVWAYTRGLHPRDLTGGALGLSDVGLPLPVAFSDDCWIVSRDRAAASHALAMQVTHFSLVRHSLDLAE